MPDLESTDEMIEAAAVAIEDEMIRHLGRDLGTIHRDHILDKTLRAVFAIVERDYDVRRKSSLHLISYPITGRTTCCNRGLSELDGTDGITRVAGDETCPGPDGTP